MELSDRLREIRRELGENQEVFAKNLGLKQGSYSGLETGAKKTLSGAVKELLAIQYGISSNWLETGEGGKYLAGYAPKKRAMGEEAEKECIECDNCPSCISMRKHIEMLEYSLDIQKKYILVLEGAKK